MPAPRPRLAAAFAAAGSITAAAGALLTGCAPSRPAPAEQREADAPRADGATTASSIHAARGGDNVVLVELFSSEGCSSCPPANRVLADLAAAPPAGTVVVALEHHVDYWDYLGWKDPFSNAEATARQRAYASVRGSSGVFTPEAVVDGAHSVTGSQRGAIVQLIEARARTPRLPIRVTLDAARTHAMVFIGAPPPRDSSLFVGIVESGLRTKVLAGENRGETLAHAPVVRRLEEVGPSRSGEVAVDLGDPVGGARSVVAFVQARPLGEVFGAAMTTPRGASRSD